MKSNAARLERIAASSKPSQANDESSFKRTSIAPRVRTRVDDALRALEHAQDDGVSEIERSNAFDEWKSHLRVAAQHTLQKSIPFRQVLGMLVASSSKRDIVAFTRDQVDSLIKVTNILRRPTVQTPDVREATRTLNGSEIRFILSLDEATSEPSDEDIARALQRLTRR